MKQLEHSTLDHRYTRKLQPDPSGGFTVTVHELPGLIAEGETADEALQNLDSAAQSWLHAARENGYPVAAPIDYDGASGKIALRVSRRIHAQAAERAELEGVSLNQFIGNALASYMGQLDGIEYLAKKVERNLLVSVRNASWALVSMQWREVNTNWHKLEHTIFRVKSPTPNNSITIKPVLKELSNVENSESVHLLS